jgi:hypothetical protein
MCGLVLAAVKAWPGSANARRTRRATASLDGGEHGVSSL